MKKRNLLSACSGTTLFKIAIVILLIINSYFKSSAQQLFGNPTISITVEHAPTLSLKFKKVAFAPATGTCSDELVNALVSDFVSNRIEVVDR